MRQHNARSMRSRRFRRLADASERRRFKVKSIGDLGRKMEGPKTFVQALENYVPEFCTRPAQSAGTASGERQWKD